jgi:hypothetical protein
MSATAEELPALLVEQRELQNSVKVLRDRIATAVSAWQRICSKLTAAPEKVVFSNAPDGLGDFSGFPPDDCLFVWDDVPDRLVVAQNVKALRDATDRLKSLERRLG